MLVLSRKRDERIVIGDEIEIQVVGIRRGQVRLGITCPRDVPVARTELVRTLSQEAPDEPVERSQVLIPH